MRTFLIVTISALLAPLSSFAQQAIIPIFPREFSAIDLRGNVRATITIADSSSSVIELHGVQSKEVTWKVKNNTLFVEVASGLLDLKGYAEVRISQPTISKIITSGAEIASAKPISGVSLSIETFGSFNSVVLDVDVDNLTVKGNGSSDIALRGRASKGHLTANIGSRIDCLSVLADSVYANVGEASEIYLTATKYLNAKATTSGTIYHTGGAALQLKSSLFGGIVEINAPESRAPRMKIETVDNKDLPAAEPQTPPSAKSNEKSSTKSSTKSAASKVEKSAVEKPDKKSRSQTPAPANTEQPESSDGDFF